jgi:RNase P subunit RPR2
MNAIRIIRRFLAWLDRVFCADCKHFVRRDHVTPRQTLTGAVVNLCPDCDRKWFPYD